MLPGGAPCSAWANSQKPIAISRDTQERRQPFARPSASCPGAPVASGGRIRQIPVIGSPRRLLGRSSIGRSAPGVRARADCRVRGIAAANLNRLPLPALPPRRNGPGNRRSAVAGESDFLALASGLLRLPCRLRGPRCFSTYTLAYCAEMSIGWAGQFSGYRLLASGCWLLAIDFRLTTDDSPAASRRRAASTARLVVRRHGICTVQGREVRWIALPI